MQEVGGKRITGARVTVLERPDKSVVTGDDAHFQIDGLDEGSEITLVMEHPGYYPLQSGTYTLGPRGIVAFTLQAISRDLFAGLAAAFPPLEQESHCIMATTVTRLTHRRRPLRARGRGSPCRVPAT